MKYLESILKRLEDIKFGISKNNTFWEGINTNIEQDIDDVNKMNSKIKNLKNELSTALAKARQMREIKKKEITKLEKRAVGIHADDESKLEDYGIFTKKTFRNLK